MPVGQKECLTVALVKVELSGLWIFLTTKDHAIKEESILSVLFSSVIICQKAELCLQFGKNVAY